MEAEPTQPRGVKGFRIPSLNLTYTAENSSHFFKDCVIDSHRPPGALGALERFKETCSRSKRRRRYLKIKPGAAPQGIQIAIQTSAESAIQLAPIQLVCRE